MDAIWRFIFPRVDRGGDPRSREAQCGRVVDPSHFWFFNFERVCK